MTSNGSLTIKTYKEEQNVLLQIIDEGQGISPEVLSKLGTPFFTTKETGTGLGLAICYSVAKRHDAQIEIETSDKGTTFSIQFRLIPNLTLKRKNKFIFLIYGNVSHASFVFLYDT